MPVILIGYNSNSDMNGDANNVIYSDNKVPIVGYDLPMIWVQSRHSLKLGVRKFKISAERTISVINRIKRTNIICLDLYAYVHRENLSNEAFKHNTDKKLNTVLRSLKLPEKHEISEKDLF